jgi:hypothetical protein
MSGVRPGYASGNSDNACQWQVARERDGRPWFANIGHKTWCKTPGGRSGTGCPGLAPETGTLGTVANQVDISSSRIN